MVSQTENLQAENKKLKAIITQLEDKVKRAEEKANREKEQAEKLAAKIPAEMCPVIDDPAQPVINEDAIRTDESRQLSAMTNKVTQGLGKPLTADDRACDDLPLLGEMNDCACALIDGDTFYQKVESDLPHEDDTKSEPVVDCEPEVFVEDLSIDDDEVEMFRVDAAEAMMESAERKKAEKMVTLNTAPKRIEILRARKARQAFIQSVTENLKSVSAEITTTAEKLRTQSEAIIARWEQDYSTDHAEANRLRQEHAQENQAMDQEFQQECQAVATNKQAMVAEHQKMVAAFEEMKRLESVTRELIETNYNRRQQQKTESVKKCIQAEAKVAVKKQALDGLKAALEKNVGVLARVSARREAVAGVFEEKLQKLNEEVDVRHNDFIEGCRAMLDVYAGQMRKYNAEYKRLGTEFITLTKSLKTEQANQVDKLRREAERDFREAQAGARAFRAILREMGEAGDETATANPDGVISSDAAIAAALRAVASPN